ncbi:MAG: VWA domain-containing protein [Gammaproteobacteria bacterium]|nr:VWA domain-containing protein [Gammaproteobacteria bacterium]
MPRNFPFAAIVGQDRLKTALLLTAIDPKIGGLLICGPRGSAKSTVVRSLTDLDPDRPFVTIPLGASEEMISGSFDLAHALNESELAFRPGLLAKAHGGVLYVDEVNLLADHLVDLLLDVAASGTNIVERDGISHRHDARFVLTGTMNPDEGELRPQLLDRFGLMARVEEEFSPEQRVEIVSRRVEFDHNPEKFAAAYQRQVNETAEAVSNARLSLSRVVVEKQIGEEIARRCALANVEGLRADIVMHRAGKAHAALHRRLEVDETDLESIEELVLAHRRRPGAPSSSGTPPRRGGSSDPSDLSPGSENRGGSSVQGAWGALPPALTGMSEPRSVPFRNSPPHHVPAKWNGRDPGKRKNGFFPSPHYLHRENAMIPKVDWYRTLGYSSRFRDLSGREKSKRLVFRYPRKRGLDLDLVLLDTSASTLSGQGLDHAKGVVKALSQQGYLHRRRLGLIAFGNARVQTLVYPQRAPKNIQPVLDMIQAGGGTPILMALEHVRNLLNCQRHHSLNCALYLLTDGRLDEATAQHALWSNYPVTVIDIESARVPLGLGKGLSEQLDSDYFHVSALPLATLH